MATLPDTVTPEGAKTEYDRYLADFWGNEAKAEFEQKKNDPALRKQYDPREIEKVIDARNAAVQEFAVAFHQEDAEAVAVAAEDPPGPPALKHGGGASSLEEQKPHHHPYASHVSLEDDIIAEDLKLTRRLVRQLDIERGVAAVGGENAHANPLAPLPGADAVSALASAEGEGEKGQGEEPQAAVVPAAAAGAAGGEGTALAPPPSEAEVAKTDALKKQEEGEAVQDSQLSPEERRTTLDALLVYLWAVHGIDYYGGKEFGGADDSARKIGPPRRTVRPPAPTQQQQVAVTAVAAAGSGGGGGEEEKKDGGETAMEESKGGEEENEKKDNGVEDKQEGGAEADTDEKKDEATTTTTAVAVAAPAPPLPSVDERARKTYEQRVHLRWKTRIEAGDPLALLLQKQRVDKEIEDFVESQVVKHEDKKWGNKLSTKMFVAKAFVLKHIRNKHGHVLDAERERLYDAIYYDNFMKAKEEEEKRRKLEQGHRGGGGHHGHGGGRFGGGWGGGGGGGRGRGRGGAGGEEVQWPWAL